MDLEHWDAWWSERGLDELTALLEADWAPIWAGADKPSHDGLRAEAIKIGEEVLRCGGVVHFYQWLWERERDLEQSAPSEAHMAELVELAGSIENWHREAIVRPLLAFIPLAVDERFRWLADEYGYVEEPCPEPTPKPLGGYVDRRYVTAKTKISVWLSLWHGFGIRIGLGPGQWQWWNLRYMGELLRLHGQQTPRIELPRKSCAGFNTLVLRAIDDAAAALRRLGPWEVSGDWSDFSSDYTPERAEQERKDAYERHRRGLGMVEEARKRREQPE